MSSVAHEFHDKMESNANSVNLADNKPSARELDNAVTDVVNSISTTVRESKQAAPDSQPIAVHDFVKDFLAKKLDGINAERQEKKLREQLVQQKLLQQHELETFDSNRHELKLREQLIQQQQKLQQQQDLALDFKRHELNLREQLLQQPEQVQQLQQHLEEKSKHSESSHRHKHKKHKSGSKKKKKSKDRTHRKEREFERLNKKCLDGGTINDSITPCSENSEASIDYSTVMRADITVVDKFNQTTIDTLLNVRPSVHHDSCRSGKLADCDNDRRPKQAMEEFCADNSMERSRKLGKECIKGRGDGKTSMNYKSDCVMNRSAEHNVAAGHGSEVSAEVSYDHSKDNIKELCTDNKKERHKEHDERYKEQSEERDNETRKDGKKEHIGNHSKEYIKEQSMEHSKSHDNTSSTDRHVEICKDQSTERSLRLNKEHTKESSRDSTKEPSIEGLSKEASRERSVRKLDRDFGKECSEEQDSNKCKIHSERPTQPVNPTKEVMSKNKTDTTFNVSASKMDVDSAMKSSASREVGRSSSDQRSVQHSDNKSKLSAFADSSSSSKKQKTKSLENARSDKNRSQFDNESEDSDCIVDEDCGSVVASIIGKKHSRTSREVIDVDGVRLRESRNESKTKSYRSRISQTRKRSRERSVEEVIDVDAVFDPLADREMSGDMSGILRKRLATSIRKVQEMKLAGESTPSGVVIMTPHSLTDIILPPSSPPGALSETPLLEIPIPLSASAPMLLPCPPIPPACLLVGMPTVPSVPVSLPTISHVPQQFAPPSANIGVPDNGITMEPQAVAVKSLGGVVGSTEPVPPTAGTSSMKQPTILGGKKLLAKFGIKISNTSAAIISSGVKLESGEGESSLCEDKKENSASLVVYGPVKDELMEKPTKSDDKSILSVDTKTPSVDDRGGASQSDPVGKTDDRGGWLLSDKAGDEKKKEKAEEKKLSPSRSDLRVKEKIERSKSRREDSTPDARSRHRSKSKDRKRSQSKESQSRDRKRSKENNQSGSRARAPSKSTDRKRSNSREDSKDRKLNKQKGHRRDSRDCKRSRSRDNLTDRKRSNSRQKTDARDRSKLWANSKDRKRSKSREKSKDKKRSKSKDRKRSISREISKDRKRSKSREKSRDRKGSRQRSSSRDHKRTKDRSTSRSRHGHRRSSREHYSSRKHRSDKRSRTKSPKAKVVDEKKEEVLMIDKAKLREIAIKNAFGMMATIGPMVVPIPSEARTADNLSFKAGGKSVEELTDFCKRIQAEKRENGGVASAAAAAAVAEADDEDDFSLKNVLKKVREAASVGIVFNIRNARQLPTLNSQEKLAKAAELRVQYPVSSGTQHHVKEVDGWVAVDKNNPTSSAVAATSDTADPTASIDEPGTIPLPDDKVFPDISPDPLLDVSKIVSERVSALRKLSSNPLDIEALSVVHKSQNQMHSWATSKQLPGQFVGSTGVQVLSQQELMGPDKRNQAWVKKDTFVTAKPVTTGIGKMLLQRMGWKEGQGLGRTGEGMKAPLMVDIKMDRRGLSSTNESARKPQQLLQQVQQHIARLTSAAGVPQSPTNTYDLSGKHPVSALGEVCVKRRWNPPAFVLVEEAGQSHLPCFKFKVIVNGIEYIPAMSSPNKKLAKMEAAAVCLQEFGLLPRT